MSTAALSPAPAPALSLVLFDLDDTLFAHREAVDLGITAHRATVDPGSFSPDDGAEVARWHALEEKHYHRYLAGELDFLGQRRARARDFVAAYGLEEGVEEEVLARDDLPIPLCGVPWCFETGADQVFAHRTGIAEAVS